MSRGRHRGDYPQVARSLDMLKHLAEYGPMNRFDLAKKLGVCERTVRRMTDMLEKTGRVFRVSGRNRRVTVRLSPESDFEPSRAFELRIRRDQTRRVAQWLRGLGGEVWARYVEERPVRIKE